MGDQDNAIGLLGGSFNPVHNGHLSIARSFLDSGYISSLWVLLTPDPPHKKDQSLAEYSLRLKMLNEAFRGWNKVHVSDIENQLPRPSYTLQTLKYLTDQNPELTFYLCLGEDSARNFTDWHKWEAILDYCTLLIARRTSPKPLELDSKVTEHSHIIDHEPVAISSTRIRKKIKTGDDISSFVPPSVERIIRENNSYK